MTIRDSIRRCRWARAAIFTVGLGTIAVPAVAQQTRALHPYVPSAAERRIELITRLMVPRWLTFDNTTRDTHVIAETAALVPRMPARPRTVRSEPRNVYSRSRGSRTSKSRGET